MLFNLFNLFTPKSNLSVSRTVYQIQKLEEVIEKRNTIEKEINELLSYDPNKIYVLSLIDDLVKTAVDEHNLRN